MCVVNQVLVDEFLQNFPYLICSEFQLFIHATYLEIISRHIVYWPMPNIIKHFINNHLQRHLHSQKGVASYI